MTTLYYASFCSEQELNRAVKVIQEVMDASGYAYHVVYEHLFEEFRHDLKDVLSHCNEDFRDKLCPLLDLLTSLKLDKGTPVRCGFAVRGGDSLYQVFEQLPVQRYRIAEAGPVLGKIIFNGGAAQESRRAISDALGMSSPTPRWALSPFTVEDLASMVNHRVGNLHPQRDELDKPMEDLD